MSSKIRSEKVASRCQSASSEPSLHVQDAAARICAIVSSRRCLAFCTSSRSRARRLVPRPARAQSRPRRFNGLVGVIANFRPGDDRGAWNALLVHVCGDARPQAALSMVGRALTLPPRETHWPEWSSAGGRPSGHAFRQLVRLRRPDLQAQAVGRPPCDAERSPGAPGSQPHAAAPAQIGPRQLAGQASCLNHLDVLAAEYEANDVLPGERLASSQIACARAFRRASAHRQ